MRARDGCTPLECLDLLVTLLKENDNCENSLSDDYDVAQVYMWCGLLWCSVVLCGVVWCGVVWCGVVWCGVVWCGGVWWGAVS